MIAAIHNLGKVYLSEGHSFLESLVQEVTNKAEYKRYTITIDLGIQPPKIGLMEIGEDTLRKVLWVGNSPGNLPQDRFTSNNICYLMQAVVNLGKRLPTECGLYQIIKKIINNFYFDLGSDFGKYRFFWNLKNFGICSYEFLPSKEKDKIKQVEEQTNTRFPEKDFLKSYEKILSIKREDSGKWMGRVFNAWLENRLKIKKNQISLYTLLFQNQILAQNRDYKAYLENIFLKEPFEEKKFVYKGKCHLCGNMDKLSGNFKKFRLKFYILDKPGFAPMLNDKNFSHLFGICQNCFKNLKSGELFVSNNLRSYFAKENVYVIPSFHREDVFSQIPDLLRFASYLKKRLSATQTLEQWHNFQRQLEEFIDFEEIKDSFSLNFLFATPSQSSFKVKKFIQDVPPSRLDLLDKVKAELYEEASKILGAEGYWDLSFGQMFYLFPIRSDGKDTKSKLFLDFFEAILCGYRLSLSIMLPIFLETATIHYFGKYDSFVQKPQNKNNDMNLIIFLLQSGLLLKYLIK